MTLLVLSVINSNPNKNMKKLITLFVVSLSLASSLRAQVTHVGTESGTTGTYGSFFGYRAAKSNTGANNTAIGHETLKSNTTGYQNTAVGAFALTRNLTGIDNTAMGKNALFYNTSGWGNTALGNSALTNNTTGIQNTALGVYTLSANVAGNYNIAIGAWALNSNKASGNVAIGQNSLTNNTTGLDNVALGSLALHQNVSGSSNVAIGEGALMFNTTGKYNSALGGDAGPSVSTLNNTTALGYGAKPTASNEVRIGSASVTRIGGQVSWSTLSDGRFKKEVKDDVSGLEFISQLHPVSYSLDVKAYNTFLGVEANDEELPEARNASIRQTGFIAQEVAEVIKKTGYVFHGVEAPQNEKDHYSIRYAEFVVPLVKAVQELNTVAKEQQKTIEEQQRKIDLLLTLISNNGGIGDKESSSGTSILFQNFPNGFTNETVIEMVLAQQVRDAAIVIYDVTGKKVKSIPVHGRGKTSVKISANELIAGNYSYTLMVNNKVVDTKKFSLTK
jgi:hypothetical protein